MSLPRRFDGIRLPPPTPLEEGGYPVTVLDAAGHVLTHVTADAWRAVHIEALCPHGRRHCFACRHRLTNKRGALAPSRREMTDADLVDAIAAHA